MSCPLARWAMRRTPEFQRIDRGRDIVHAHDRAPRSTAISAAATLACRRSIDGAAGDRAERGLARPADQQRRAEAQQFALSRQQTRGCVDGLAEADAGVEHDTIEGDAGNERGVAAVGEERGHVEHDIAVVRRGLHRARLALHVHQADAAHGVRRHGFERARPLQGAHVVDDVGAEVERGTHHRGLAGVHRHRHAQRQRMAQHRQHARQLFVGARRARAGARRFAADVEHVGALAHEPVAMRDRITLARRTGRHRRTNPA